MEINPERSNSRLGSSLNYLSKSVPPPAPFSGPRLPITIPDELSLPPAYNSPKRLKQDDRNQKHTTYSRSLTDESCLRLGNTPSLGYGFNGRNSSDENRSSDPNELSFLARYDSELFKSDDFSGTQADAANTTIFDLFGSPEED